MKYLIIMTMLTFVYPGKSFSQSLDSLVTGKKYRITLFNEKEILGTLILQNDSTVTLKYENVNATVFRNDILKISKDTSPTKYKFLATLNTGYVLNGSYNNDVSNYIIEGRFSYFYSEKKNIGAEITYVSFKKNEYEYLDYGGYGYGSYSGGKLTYLDFFIIAQVGTFDKENVIDLYVNLGLGMHFNIQNSFRSTYYSFYDSSYFSSENPSSLTVYPMAQIGGGLIIKPVYNFGINLEVDMNVYGFEYIFIPTEAYFPIKAGVSYYFMK